MPSLLLTSVKQNRRAAAAGCVRSAWRVLGIKGGLVEALALVKNLVDTGQPQVVGSSDDVEALDAALALFEAGICAGRIDVDEPLPEPADENEEEAGPFSSEAYETAMVLLALVRGNPTNALASAGALERTAGTPEFYDEVQAVLVSVFPRQAFVVVAGDE